MKNALLTLTLLITLSWGAIAATNGLTASNDYAAGLKAKISKVLQVPDFLKKSSGITSAVVTFTVNENYQIVVKDVMTDDQRLKDYVTEKLHMMPVDDNLSHDLTYSITVSFEML